MRITPIATGLLVLVSLSGVMLLAPQRSVLRAAESSDAAGSVAPASSESVADQTGLKKGTTSIDKNSPVDGAKERLATAKLEGCKSQFGLADVNGDGVLDAREIANYNSTIRSERQPPLPDIDRLTETDFIAACGAVTAHE